MHCRWRHVPRKKRYKYSRPSVRLLIIMKIRPSTDDRAVVNDLKFYHSVLIPKNN